MWLLWRGQVGAPRTHDKGCTGQDAAAIAVDHREDNPRQRQELPIISLDDRLHPAARRQRDLIMEES